MIYNFKQFILEKFKETEKNTPVLYKDDNLEVKVVKTFTAAKEQGKDTKWCSNEPSGFYSHDLTANMYRFNFKDGYKLRLTWDYISQKASALGNYSGGTHWGQGGKIDGKEKHYYNIRPKDEESPFDFNYHKNDEKQEMVDRILSIPDDAKLAVYQYQEDHTKDKTSKVNAMYQEIQKIKVIDVELQPEDNDYYFTNLKVKLQYLNKKYDADVRIKGVNYREVKGDVYYDVWIYELKLKNAYASGSKELEKYIFDKTMEFIKKNNLTNVLSRINEPRRKEYDKSEWWDEEEDEELNHGTYYMGGQTHKY